MKSALKIMRLVSHGLRRMETPAGRPSDVTYDDQTIFVNPECFVYAEPVPRDGCFRSSRDRIRLCFGRGSRVVDVYMWPDEFEMAFGRSIDFNTTNRKERCNVQ